MRNCRVCKQKASRSSQIQYSMSYNSKSARFSSGKKVQKTTQCKTCSERNLRIREFSVLYSSARRILAKRYNASLKAYVRRVKYISLDEITAECVYMDDKQKEVVTYTTVDYSWVVRTFGETYASFMRKLCSNKDSFVPIEKDSLVFLNRVAVQLKWGTNRTNARVQRGKGKGTKSEKIVEGWFGIDTHGNQFKIDEKDLKRLFSKSYLNLVKQYGISKGQFVHVPVGTKRDKSTLHEHPKIFNPGGPQVTYRQNDQDLCGMKSFVSALHYLGFEQEAKKKIFNL